MADWVREEDKPDPGIPRSASSHAPNRVLSLCAATLFSLPIGVYLRYYEGGANNQFFVWSITLALGAWIVVALRRILVASVLVNAFVGIVATVSWAKQQAMDMALHAYDVVFYLSSWATIDYLWNGFRLHVVALVAGMLAIAIAAGVAYRLDATRVSRGSALIAALVLTIAAGVATAFKEERRHNQYYWGDSHISSFYSSWAETAEMLWRGQLIEAAKSAPGPHFAVPTDCATTSKPPHIILIHEESVVPPGYFPALRYDHRLDPFFASQDGKVHRMRVEWKPMAGRPGLPNLPL
jgi:hypothetical protein